MADIVEETYDMFDEEGTNISSGPDVTEDTKKKTERLRTLADVLEITVSEPEKQVKPGGLKMQDTYTAYLVETKPRNLENIDPELNEVTSVWRRYSEFELLRNYLVVKYPAVVMAPMPEKRANFIWTKIATDTFDPEFLEKRRAALEVFLHRICGHTKMCNDNVLRAFFKQAEGWRDVVMATGYQADADSWLRTLNASWRVKQPDSSLEEVKTYANELHNNISTVLKARAKLVDRLYAIYKIHGNYARIYKEWSTIEDSQTSEILRKASLEIDKLSNSIDALVDEEETYAELLKEYFYFADSLKAVVKKHESLQYDVEYYENQLMTAHITRKQISDGEDKSFSFSGMKAKLFGGDTPEQKEAKLVKVDENIKRLKSLVEEKRTAANSFLSETKKEIQSFKSRRQLDIREILTNYVILQIKMAKAGKTTWTHFKAILQSL